MKITDRIKEQAAMRAPAVGGMGNVGNEMYDPTQAGTTDLGPLVDDANVHDAGGYAPPIPEPNYAPESTGPRRRRTLRRWSSVRYAFAATDTAPILATPSGIDGLDIVSVTLAVDTANRVRIGDTSNNAQAGGYIPTTQPLNLGAGPVWLCPVAGAGAVNVDVFTEWDDPGPEDSYTKRYAVDADKDGQ